MNRTGLTADTTNRPVASARTAPTVTAIPFSMRDCRGTSPGPMSYRLRPRNHGVITPDFSSRGSPSFWRRAARNGRRKQSRCEHEGRLSRTEIWKWKHLPWVVLGGTPVKPQTSKQPHGGNDSGRIPPNFCQIPSRGESLSVAKSGGAVLCTGHIQEPASGTESSNLTCRQSDSHPLSYTQSPLRLPFSTTITPRDAPKPSHGCGCRPVSVVSRDRTYRRSIALKWIQLRQATCLRRVTVSPFTSDRAWSRLCAANFPSRTRPPRVKAPYRLCALAVRMRR